VDEVSNNQEQVSEVLRQNISEALKRTPLEIKQFGLADIRYPDTIRQAMEATQERIIAIERADADAQVKIREAQARLEVTRAEREADLLAAQTISDQNVILADGVTPAVLRYMELQVLKEMANNQSAIFFPIEMLGNTALENRLTMGVNK
jgi:regulator of protease activity HflC (stomatin/prohibitin superfamily)